MTRLAAVVVAALAAYAVGAGARQAPQASVEDGWRTFSANWSASGQRQALPTEGDRPAAVLRVSGAIVVTGGAGLGRGFLGEVIGYDDGRGASVGRAVWTDDRGDRIYSELKGEPIETGHRVSGVITGGTGRYAGANGDYTFTWQFVAHAEDGAVQGRTASFTGRIRGTRQ